MLLIGSLRTFLSKLDLDYTENWIQLLIVYGLILRVQIRHRYFEVLTEIWQYIDDCFVDSLFNFVMIFKLSLIPCYLSVQEDYLASFGKALTTLFLSYYLKTLNCFSCLVGEHMLLSLSDH